MFCAVGFTNGWLAKLDVLEANGDFLVNNVEFDETTFVVVNFLIGSDSDVSNDFLHSREGVVSSRDAVVIGCKLVVNKAAFFEK